MLIKNVDNSLVFVRQLGHSENSAVGFASSFTTRPSLSKLRWRSLLHRLQSYKAFYKGGFQHVATTFK